MIFSTLWLDKLHEFGKYLDEEEFKLFAVVHEVDGNYIARYERHLKHSVATVWAALTENDKLGKWFPELRVVDLREGGSFRFDFPNGKFDKLQITELKTHSVLEYTWWGDSVCFELLPESEGCRLVLQRKVKTITDHTAKDLAGWHVCLDVIDALLNETVFESKEEHWKNAYQEYTRVCQEFR